MLLPGGWYADVPSIHPPPPHLNWIRWFVWSAWWGAESFDWLTGKDFLGERGNSKDLAVTWWNIWLVDLQKIWLVLVVMNSTINPRRGLQLAIGTACTVYAHTDIVVVFFNALLALKNSNDSLKNSCEILKDSCGIFKITVTSYKIAVTSTKLVVTLYKIAVTS